MIQSTTVDGRPAVTSFISLQFEPVDEAAAELVKVTFTDPRGGVMFLVPDRAAGAPPKVTKDVAAYTDGPAPAEPCRACSSFVAGHGLNLCTAVRGAIADRGHCRLWGPRAVTKGYDPDEARDAAGRWASGGSTPPGSVVVYHGTWSSVVDSIKKNGLTIRGNKRNFESGEYAGERGQSVFVSKSLDEARGWPLLGANRGGAVVVFEIHIPESELVRLKDDEFRGGDGTSYRFQGVIPPDWIKGHSVQDRRTNSWSDFKKLPAQDNFFVTIVCGAGVS